MTKKKISAIIVGAGHRALIYASYAQHCPDELEIVGVADPNPLRRKMVAEMYNLKPEQCHNSAEELASKGKLADAILNGTMDAEHVPTSLPLLEAGYDMLLEKPFAVTEDEVHQLNDAAQRLGRKVMICHVLRYAPFYTDLKARVLKGEIGEIMNIQTAEHVSYHHMASCYVRGKWNRDDVCGSSMLMAKCCHDLDLITWFKSGVKPINVSSFGGLHYFCAAKAPKDSGTYCLLDCPIENKCLYSARKHYLDHPERWAAYVWAGIEHIENPTIEQKEAYLKQKDHLYGRCVWKCDNNVVDRQSVAIEFADGTTATHNMVGGTSRPMRKIHIIGSEGELHGIMDDSKYVIRHIDNRPGCEYTEEEVDLKITGDMSGAFGGHGGGDLRLTADFVATLRGEKPSISCTTIDDSVNGHLIGFAADRAMHGKQIVKF